MTLLDYIRGERRGREAHRLEREAMNDPFLTDALDGFHDTEGDHARTIERLHRKVWRRASGREKSAAILRWSAAAAGVLLLLGVGGALLLRPAQQETTTMLADRGEPAATPEIAFSEVSQDSAESAMDQPAGAESPEALTTVYEIRQIETTASFADFAPEEEMLPEEEPIQRPLTKSEIRQQAEGIQADVEPETVADETLVEELAAPVTRAATAAGVSAPQASKPSVASAAASAAEATDAAASSDAPASLEAAASRPAGGMEAFLAYVRENLRPTPDAEGNAAKGRVVLEFRIDRQGRPIGIRIVESLTPAADREARRLLQSGPAWTRSDDRITIAIDF